MKNETIEEAAEKYAELSYYNRDDINSFVNGAKWQAERMYSEEDMREAFREGVFNYEGLEFSENRFNNWFEQFKKEKQ
jgi:hypothetical protein